jgi:uncharacterized protein (TIGR02266 family)
MALHRTPSNLGATVKAGQQGKVLARKILLMGDKPTFAALRQSLLRSGESKVLVAASGGEGLRVALTTLPDAILLDADLPDLDALEVCRRLRSDPLTEAIPVIVLTGNTTPALNQKAYDTHAVACVPMGIDPARLLNVIRMILSTPLTRRTAPRASVALGVDYLYADRTGTGKTLNLSHDGMFIVTPNPPEVDTHLILHFALPDSEPLEATARVVWIRPPGEDHPYPPGMAVQFQQLPPDARPAIAAFVTSLLATSTPSQET